jgi:hypothetical protein
MCIDFLSRAENDKDKAKRIGARLKMISGPYVESESSQVDMVPQELPDEMDFNRVHQKK